MAAGHQTHKYITHNERISRHRSSVRALMTTTLMAGIYSAVSVAKFINASDSIYSISEVHTWGYHTAISCPLFLVLALYTEWLGSNVPESGAEGQIQVMDPMQNENSADFIN